LPDTPVEHERLVGYWETVYTNEKENMWLDCNVMELKATSDPKIMQIRTGAMG
jgi:hypothetical protein